MHVKLPPAWILSLVVDSPTYLPLFPLSQSEGECQRRSFVTQEAGGDNGIGQTGRRVALNAIFMLLINVLEQVRGLIKTKKSPPKVGLTNLTLFLKFRLVFYHHIFSSFLMGSACHVYFGIPSLFVRCASPPPHLPHRALFFKRVYVAVSNECATSAEVPLAFPP